MGMINEDAIKYLSNLKQDIGQSSHEDLWPYAQVIDEIIAMLTQQELYISKETRLNRDEYCRVGDVLDCFDGMDMKADEVFHAVCLIEWAMSKRSVPLDQLLKDQGPHILTIDQLEDALDTVVWLETPVSENLADRYSLITAYNRKCGYMFFISPFGDDPSQDRMKYSEYGRSWRCWDKRPSEEQRKAVKWDA